MDTAVPSLETFGEVQQVWHPWRHSGFLSWQFHILNHKGHIISTVDRAFRGFGRRYSINFKPSALSLETQLPGVSALELKNPFPSTAHELDIDTRAVSTCSIALEHRLRLLFPPFGREWFILYDKLGLNFIFRDN
ncbi:hypothetical protein JR316_0003620 [Psilocybe cubensis]|uniref:Uncharacterized protein n=1 Tax=Psilocybe cubensis TaxID=181762 RepID=A0ACB8H8U1_PSICU|nr:hypothetical protein JR316_0003620 [Psilocybe cubensis]KAH9484140.1 hypothetical protein JR316_0003620 [Psilocybe cubensis]